MTITLSVLSGLHRGAKATFPVPPSGDIFITLGADALRTDITLLDPGILPVHCRLAADKNGLRLCENNSSVPPEQGNRHILPGDHIVAGKRFECAGISFSAQYTTAAIPFRHRKIVFIFVFILLFISAGLFFFTRPGRTIPSAEQFLSAEPYRCLSREKHDNKWIIRGSVTRAAEKELVAFFRQQDIAYRLNISTPDTELNTLNSWLSAAPNNHLTAELSTMCGHITIRGTRAPHQQKISMKDFLPALLIPSGMLIDDQSIITDDYIKKTDLQINTVKKSNDILSYMFTETSLVIITARKESAQLKKQLSVFLDTFNREFAFNYQPEFRVQPISKPGIRISAVSLGEIPYIITDSGGKYRAGSSPDNDTRVISIDKEKVVLLYKNEYYTIVLTDDKK